MRTYTPEELRALSRQVGPQWSDQARAALSYAADVMAAASAVIEQPAKDNIYAEDKAVDHFARHMKYKLEKARQRGRSGWQDRAWTPEQISQALHEHVEKGDPVDVANYCMFLAARKELIYPAQPPVSAKPLTDEQIDSIKEKTIHSYKRRPGLDYENWFARAIEAAHGIKE